MAVKAGIVSQDRKARLTLIDMCCDMSLHSIIVIVAMIGMCSYSLSCNRNITFCWGNIFFLLMPVLICDSVSAVSSCLLAPL